MSLPVLPPLVRPDNVVAAIAHVEETLPTTMRDSNVPGLSLAVIDAGRLLWSSGFGFAHQHGLTIAPSTLFQVGSISKPIAAATILALCDRGNLDLDAPVTRYLGSWTLPGATSEVSLRRLLSHTAGLSVHGYKGILQTAPFSSTIESLEGDESSAGQSVSKVSEVGQWSYSGGGYTVCQLAVETVTGRPFSDVAHEHVLLPLRMTRSRYSTRATWSTPGMAGGHDKTGSLIPAHKFAETAAAGLCSTADDLALFVLSLTDGSSRSRLMAKAAKGTGGTYGLGLQVHRSASDLLLAHIGINQGYRAYFSISPVTGFGISILTNGDAGTAVIRAILKAFTY
ncbi:serine hydrolase domain-containing protein [Nakamurella sp. GG22]